MDIALSVNNQRQLLGIQSTAKTNQKPRFSFHKRFRHLQFFFVLFLWTMASVAHGLSKSSPDETFYDILEITPTASLQDIKKAYRRLALQFHPDRNPPEKKEAATIQFRKVNEAYEVLSDPDQRRQYDLDLKRGATYASSNTGSTRPQYAHTSSYGHGRQYRDAFAQFNDLFQNDPFFNEAFKEMDDLFAKTFQQQHPSKSQRQASQPHKKSWGQWIADCLGIDFQITTSSTTIGPDGRTSHSSTSYGGNRNSAYQSSSYTSKSTRTVIENGQRVTIQSLEKDGNKIEEKYINNQLVQRLINGIPEHQYRIGHGNADL